jgi:hypothetical protein
MNLTPSSAADNNHPRLQKSKIVGSSPERCASMERQKEKRLDLRACVIRSIMWDTPVTETQSDGRLGTIAKEVSRGKMSRS